MKYTLTECVKGITRNFDQSIEKSHYHLIYFIYEIIFYLVIYFEKQWARGLNRTPVCAAARTRVGRFR